MRCFIILIVFFSLLLRSQAKVSRDTNWWEDTVFYQIYTRSFMDSDDDGIGDFNGIASRLDYLKELGVGAVWLPLIYKSPMHDFGYDVIDFYSIQPEYGSMEDFENLISKTKELGIKIILDFIPNHISNESVWFEQALKGHPKYYRYFIWESPAVKNGVMRPPTNWNSVFHGSAWTYREEVGKYYLHQFGENQPDLNYRNADVVQEMLNVLEFWLDKGVAGFVVDAVNHLFEVNKDDFEGKYPNEPISENYAADNGNYDYYEHVYTKNQEETYAMVYFWRKIMDQYKARDGVTRFLMTKAYTTPERTMRYFGIESGVEGAHTTLNYALITDIWEDTTAHEMKYATDKFLNFKPLDKLANWMAGSHDIHRVASRFSPMLVDAINIIVLLFPGVAFTYMGEELGMEDGFVSWKDTVDPHACALNDAANYMLVSRDPQRTPFQWSSAKNSGFTNATKPWLPVADGYLNLNMEAQEIMEDSHLNLYKSLVQLRGDNTFRRGRFESFAFNNEVFAFRRWRKNDIYVAVINLRMHSHYINLTYFENVSGDVKVILRNKFSPTTVGEILSSEKVEVAPYEAFIVKVKKFKRQLNE